jgi:adenylate cyclase class IV
MKRTVKQEIEVKLRVADPAALRRLLRRLGGRVLRRVHEMNTLFDTPRGTLYKRGRLLRLRQETSLTGRRAQRYVLTFKAPAKFDRDRLKAQAPSAPLGTSESLCYTPGRYKVREETEYIVGDPRAFFALVRAAGMRSSFRYEKFRTSYSLPRAGGAHVELDETPAGVFLELEGARRAIDRLARRLGYRTADYITRSYAALHFEECRRRGVRAGDMVFGSQKK